MQARTLGTLMLAAVGTLFSASANGQETPAPAAGALPGSEPAPAAAEPAQTTTAEPAAPEAPPSKMRVGVNLVPMPIGKVKVNVGGVSNSTNTAIAFGLAPFYDYAVNEFFFVGGSLQYTLNVKASGAGSAGSAFDILARAGGNAPVTDTVSLYGYVTPGYGFVMPPSGGSTGKGFIIGFHGGAMMAVTSTIYVEGQLGYQLGFQKANSVDTRFSYLQIGLGGGIKL